MQCFHAIHSCQSLAVQLQDDGIVPADDRERRRLHALQRVSRLEGAETEREQEMASKRRPTAPGLTRLTQRPRAKQGPAKEAPVKNGRAKNRTAKSAPAKNGAANKGPAKNGADKRPREREVEEVARPANESGELAAPPARQSDAGLGKYVYCVIHADKRLVFGPLGIGAEP